MAGLLIKELKIRGLVRRILIVTPAKLTFQWQREMIDKFHERFEVIRGDILRATYGSNPWQERNQVITSLSWVSRIEDAKESLLRSHWDLVVVDEVHKMSAYSESRRTLAYQLGEELSKGTDHYLLMTATPHKGDPQNFCLFLQLLDKDIYGNVKSLEEAIRRNHAPFYLRRVKEALVTFPDPDTGEVKTLSTQRIVQTVDFELDMDEWDFYDALTRYVEDQSIKASSDDSPHGRAVGFTMAMLQRRFASSVYAVRRTLERMRDRRERILEDPERYRQEQILRRLPDDFEDMEDAEREKARFPYFQRYAAHQVRDGYFAKRKKKGTAEEEAFDTSGRTVAQRKAEKATFALIMRNKEQFLSFEEPVCFIFAHSALKEGWDNPNVFQICTLNQTVSEMKKRQEIGRGLRIAVNQEGERVFHDEVNVLTVVANQSYQRYVSLLQAQYVEDGQMPPPNPSRVGRSTVTRNDALFQSKHFRAFWRKLSRLTKYQIDVDTPTLIERCVERLNNKSFPKAVIVVERGQYVVTQFTLTLESVTATKAMIRIDTELTTGDRSSHTGFYAVKDGLARLRKDDRFRGLRVQEIIDDGEDSKVVFGNGVELHINAPYVFSSEQGQAPLERAQLAPEHKYPVFNLLDRAARETGLTRPTINRILRGTSDQKKQHLLKNPEGFANVFLSQIRAQLAAHIVERLKFVLDHGQSRYVLDELFPPTKTFPQNELVDAGETSLYDRVQIDSDIEKSFVGFRLTPDPKVIGYFKFPPAFRIPFPKIVGNYNPDWGIQRYSDDGRVVLQLVRETKGHEETSKLRFRHEQRKIDAARKHFRRIGIDYRPITDQTVDWWRPEEGERQPLGI